ncbi:MAG: serine acetyltransferase [Bergeyella sp.]|nr:serine acetyltransferase [Bergeyella sp.]
MKKRTIIQKDFYRESGQWLTGLQILKKCIHPNLRYIFVLRKCQQPYHFRISVFFWKMLLKHYQVKYGYQIYPDTRIGEGFYLGHWGHVVINPRTRIGKNCNIAPGVVIGQQNRGEKKGVPDIGNDVWIGANAVIVGKIKIGDNVLIAPASYVHMDIPSNSVVSGNPASIFMQDEATEGYINHRV